MVDEVKIETERWNRVFPVKYLIPNVGELALLPTIPSFHHYESLFSFGYGVTITSYSLKQFGFVDCNFFVVQILE